MDGIILQLNSVSVGTGDANRKCWYPQCPRPVLDLVFRKKTKDVVLEWLLLLSSFTCYLMFLFIVEIGEIIGLHGAQCVTQRGVHIFQGRPWCLQVSK